MRAEAQNHVEKIEKSLDLLKQRLGWETAQHRLEEFNARERTRTCGTTPRPRRS